MAADKKPKLADELKTRRENMLKEIDLIQDIIKRMAHNSFLIKGWTVTLVTVALLLRSEMRNFQVIVAFIPLIVFWILDAYFLRLERLYRKLYNWVRTERMKTDEELFNLNPYRLKHEPNPGIPGVMFSITLISFYGSIFVMLVLYTVYLICRIKAG